MMQKLNRWTHFYQQHLKLRHEIIPKSPGSSKNYLWLSVLKLFKECINKNQLQFFHGCHNFLEFRFLFNFQKFRLVSEMDFGKYLKIALFKNYLLVK